MNTFIQLLKRNSKIKSLILLTITPKRNPKPRFWVKIIINPFIHKRGKGSIIRKRRSRIDVFPWNRFDIGKNTTIEDFTTINNGAGDLIFGDNVRIGIGSVVLGPVTIKSGAGLGQHVFIAGFNHGYKDASLNSKYQKLDKRPVIIEEDSHIGANSVIVAGVHIGKRCQIGAGSVVTKDIPSYSIAAGNPAKILKQYDFEKQEWIRVKH